MSSASVSYRGGTLRSKHFWRSKAALKPGVQPGLLDVGWQVKGKKTQGESEEKGLEMEKGIGWSMELVCLLFLDF